jgi:hypothetical protein
MKVEILNNEIKNQEQGMLAGFTESKDTVAEIHNRLAALQQKSQSLTSRIFMSSKDKALLAKQGEHDIKLIDASNHATLQQTSDILATRTKACREACNSMLLTVVASLKAISASQANVTITSCINKMSNDMEAGLRDIDEQLDRASKFRHESVRETAFRKAATALRSIENTYDDLVTYVQCNNLLMPIS